MIFIGYTSQRLSFVMSLKYANLHLNFERVIKNASQSKTFIKQLVAISYYYLF
jgi:hypothetical protein